MALKGKKKSRSRGSQARRRPAAAPRPTYGGRDRARWYQTTGGIVGVVTAVAAILIFGTWLVLHNRSEARELEQKQEALETYTGKIQSLSQTLAAAAGELQTGPSLNDKDLAEKTEGWKKVFSDAQAELSTTQPPPGLEVANSLLLQSILTYSSAVESFSLLPDLEGDARAAVSGQAMTAFQSATSLFTNAVQLIDDERSEVELGRSRITIPGSEPQQTPPGTTSTDELSVGGDNKGGGKGGNKGGNKGKGKGDK